DEESPADGIDGRAVVRVRDAGRRDLAGLLVARMAWPALANVVLEIGVARLIAADAVSLIVAEPAAQRELDVLARLPRYGRRSAVRAVSLNVTEARKVRLLRGLIDDRLRRTHRPRLAGAQRRVVCRVGGVLRPLRLTQGRGVARAERV